MAVADDARRDLREKLILERKFVGEIRAFNKKMVGQLVKKFAAGDGTLDAAELQPELIGMLTNHYDRVGKPFSTQITDVLPEDIEATPEERASIAAALAAFFAARAPEQAEIIATTNQKGIDSSIDQAIAISQEEAVAGRSQSRGEIAILAGVALSRKLAGRVTGIAALETQAAAETAKATEVQVLTGQPPSVTGGTLRDTPVTKEWFTQGDERVREAHILADSQSRSLNQPFEVGGQLLRWPGDTSLGATAGNVVNCRCSSVVNAQSVFAERRRIGEQPRIDQTASEQLLTSLGG